MTFFDSIGHQIATSKAKAAGFNKTHPASFQWLSRQRQHRQEFILSNLCKCILLLMDGRVLASQCTVCSVQCVLSRCSTYTRGGQFLNCCNAPDVITFPSPYRQLSPSTCHPLPAFLVYVVFPFRGDLPFSYALAVSLHLLSWVFDPPTSASTDLSTPTDLSTSSDI